VANRKQQKRRAKRIRMGIPEDATGPSEPSDRPVRAAKSAPPARRGRSVPVPSLRRSIKRGVIFIGLVTAALYLLGGSKHPFLPLLLQAVVIMLFFIPFDYYLGRFMYRKFGGGAGGGAAGGGAPGSS
jgi:hypothetical protein